ncbi:pyrroloquinoline quinone precursor peptide PqqA [Burkholderia cenocepacia]|nr:pyrroloquinoline quinone precursor peptide PqqA [Burkholderia cenocepacia]QUO29196.1 pyrroloquinoline quinone precursor peptide PqqA [Burkholderia cenocepacia]
MKNHVRLCEDSVFLNDRRGSAMWTKPACTNLRLGFEITMYVFNR